MYKHPLEYTKEDLEKLLNVPIRIEIGKLNSDVIENSYEGRITNFSLAVGNVPKLPADIYFRKTNGEAIRVNIEMVKTIYII